MFSVKDKAVRCRIPEGDWVLTVRAGRLWTVVPGEIAVIRPRRQWSYAGHPYLSGDLESSRLDVPALGLVPLRLEQCGLWNPSEHYWGEAGEPSKEWAEPIIARGPRPEFVMEQVLPGHDSAEADLDPICEANAMTDTGELDGARSGNSSTARGRQPVVPEPVQSRRRRGLPTSHPTFGRDSTVSKEEGGCAMPQLLVRRIEDEVVRKLKEQAGRHGVSMEEEHRRILREALLGKPSKKQSFKEFLMSMPNVGPDELFERDRDMGREVKL